MRGKAVAAARCGQILGITPAYAGKRVRRFQKWRSVRDHPRLCGEKHSTYDSVCLHCQDHPRLCGEKCLHTLNCCYQSGSPPPMRGKDTYYWGGAGDSRITPAYAGKRDWNVHEAARPKDHPRLCGEKWWRKMYVYRVSGSPPPMRGKVYFKKGQSSFSGITPAYAGKS